MGIFFGQQMGCLCKVGICVFVFGGNYDVESEMMKKLMLFDNVMVFGYCKLEIFRLLEFDVVLYGQSFKDKVVVDNFVVGYLDLVFGYYNIGVLYMVFEGYVVYVNYVLCMLVELYVKGYDYWVFGYVYEFQ